MSDDDADLRRDVERYMAMRPRESFQDAVRKVPEWADNPEAIEVVEELFKQMVTAFLVLMAHEPRARNHISVRVDSCDGEAFDLVLQRVIGMSPMERADRLEAEAMATKERLSQALAENERLRAVSAALWLDAKGPIGDLFPRGCGDVARRILEVLAHHERALDSGARAGEDEPEPPLTWADAIVRARGCFDCLGGYHGPMLEAFHHGIQTVINALEAGRGGTQERVLDAIGRDAEEQS